MNNLITSQRPHCLNMQKPFWNFCHFIDSNSCEQHVLEHAEHFVTGLMPTWSGQSDALFRWPAAHGQGLGWAPPAAHVWPR